MKKIIFISLLCLSAFLTKAQTLRINKYLVDSMISAGVQVLYYDTTHTGQWKNISQQAGGGGSGSGTVNSGTQYRIAYYATTGTAVSAASAITGNRALVSDANGVPTHSTVTTTELGYVSGVTSAIQTQLNGKQASGSYAVTTNNLSDLSNAATARTNLGATTVGGNFFTLVNPGAIAFPRINADNTVSALDAATFRTAIGAGTGGGSVTDVSVVSANGFAGTVATSTSTPAITLTTTITGILKGNGTAISAATSGTDYSAGTSALATGILKSTTTTGTLSIAVAGDFPTLNQNTTGSAATLTTPRAIYGNNFDGSAALTQIIASTYGGTGNGFTKFSGPATTEKTFTLPNASATILTDNAAVTVAQGGTGLTSINALSIWVANSSNTITTVTPAAGQSVRVNAGGTAWEAYTPGSGGGDVTKVGTPVNNQIGVWTGNGTLEGDANYTWDGSGTMQMTAANSILKLNGTTTGSIYFQSSNADKFYLQNYTRAGGANFDIEIYNAQTGAFSFFIDGNTDYVGIGNNTTPSQALHVSGSGIITGNILMGGTSVATSATTSFHLFNGTVPSASITNGVLLYSEDVAASAELKVRDEAGNITVLGPHTFTGIPGGRSEEMAWAFYSERDGKYINVDMLKLARTVEKLTGEKLVFIGKTTDELPNKENK